MSRSRCVGASLLLTIMMVATSFAVLATPSSAGLPSATADGDLEEDSSLTYSPVQWTSPNPGDKIDPRLAEAMKRSDGPFKVQILVTDRAAANQYLGANDLPLVSGMELPWMPASRLMALTATDILGLASNPGVVKIFQYERPNIDQTSLQMEIAGDGWAAAPLEVEDLHGASDAWLEGFTGAGVNIAVIDTGFDMAHPDLQGQQARYTFGPYDGWPIAYDDQAAWMWYLGEIGGWVADTRATSPDIGGYVEFDGSSWRVSDLRDVGGSPVVSQSGVYHIGYHTDQNLATVWPDPIGVLVVDAAVPGVYDTVYVDVYTDFSFNDEKACTIGDEISYSDFYDSGTDEWSYGWNSGDGYADLSGGMVYWVSDGVNVYPASDWMYGASWVPGSGDAVAFMGEFSYGESHGTMTSSAAIATGTSWDGRLAGMAPDAKLICIPFTGNIVSSWLFAAIGADGSSSSGDEATIVSNSYGWSDTAVEAGYGQYDQITSLISQEHADGLWFWSTGDGGPGYGTAHSPVDAGSVHVGAGNTMLYRHQLGFESDWNYTKWGDVAPSSNSGPARNGKLNAEIIASGDCSLEAAPLNQWDDSGRLADGSRHYQIGGGTSHATPTAAGGAALGAQAFYENWGYWPSFDYAKAKLMAAADDMHFDPLKQGAGWLNAYRYSMLMGGWEDGVDTLLQSNEPAFVKAALYPGQVYGTSYEYFPNLMLPGEWDASHIASTSNYNLWVDATVNVTSKLLLRTGSTTISFTTPDADDVYLDITDDIPIDTDLLKVTIYMPMAQFDAELDYESDVEYRLELHDWFDEDTDGIMDIAEGEWELYEYSADGSDCNYNQIMMKDPVDRTTDGLMVRLVGVAGAAGIDMTVQLDCYELQTFPWVTFRTLGDVDWSIGLDSPVPAGSVVDWEINVTVPADAPLGTYAAAIYVDDGIRAQNIPVVINVAADSYEFEFGGPSHFDTPYNNDFTGIANKDGGFETGDWKIFYAMPSIAPPSAEVDLVVTAEWTELPTDVNIHVLAPDFASYDHWDPPFGPGMTMVPIASSDEKYMGEGLFGVYTNTGGPKEVVASPMGMWYDQTGTGPAPFAIVTRCPVMSGNAPSDTIAGRTAWLTMNDYAPTDIDLLAPQPGPYPLSGEIPGWYDLTVPEPVEVRGGGSGPFVVDAYDMQTIWQDALTGDLDQDVANAQYSRQVQVEDCPVLKVIAWEELEAPDIDLAAWYDANMNGIADLSEPHWHSSNDGFVESVTVDDPQTGSWIVKILGRTVTGSPGYFSMEIWTGVEGYITVVDLQSPVGSGVHTFNVAYSVPAESDVYVGFATFGFMGAYDLYSIPLRIEVQDEGAPEIQNLYPAFGQAIPTDNLVVEFRVNDSVYPVYSGPDWDTLSVLLDWTIPVDEWSWRWIDGETIRLEFPLSIREGYHELCIEIADLSGNLGSCYSWFTVNSEVDLLTAEFQDPVSGDPIPDGATVALTNVTVIGQTEAYADVDICTPGAVYSTSASDAGYYELTNISLAEGVNAMTVVATNEAGVQKSVGKMLVRDTTCMLWVADVTSPTRESALHLSGWTDARANVTVDGDDATMNPDGTWTADVILAEGVNYVNVESTDTVGNVAQVLIEVELDTTPPSLAIVSPDDGSETSEPSVTVSGTTDEDAEVRVNGVLAGNGSENWSARIVLAEGENAVLVVATDPLGNSVTESIAVEYVPPVYVTPDDLEDAIAAIEYELADLRDEMAALEAMLLDEIGGLNDTLLDEIDNLQALIDALEDLAADLQEQLNAANEDTDDLWDELEDLEDRLSDDIGTVDQKAEDADAFAGMLLYLTLVLFVIALTLIGLVWLLMSRKTVGRSGGTPPHSFEEVGPPSEAELELEALEKRMKQGES